MELASSARSWLHSSMIASQASKACTILTNISKDAQFIRAISALDRLTRIVQHCARGKLEVANSQLLAIAAKMQCDILALITDGLKDAVGQPYRDAMTSCQLKNVADMIPMLMGDGNCGKSEAVISSRIKRNSTSRSPKSQSSTTVALVVPDAADISSAFPHCRYPDWRISKNASGMKYYIQAYFS